MDLLTQGVLGAVLAQSGSRAQETRLATGVGFAAGMLADADILIRSSSDPLLSIEFHRHFTHSIFFIPLGALIATVVLWPFLRNRIAFKRLYIFSLLGYSLSGFIDACTSYGTYLLWPLYDERIAFHIISIVDPVFTLALIAAAVLAFKWRDSRAARTGLMVAGLYLLIGVGQMMRAESVATSLAHSRDHQPNRLVAKPTIGNLILWRSIYEYDGRLYVDAVRVGFSSSSHQGGSVKQFSAETDLPGLGKHTILYGDIGRFRRFSDGYIGISPEDPRFLGDMRYALLPNGLEPLWGIEINEQLPDQHAPFSFRRQFSAEKRQRFWILLSGQQVAQ